MRNLIKIFILILVLAPELSSAQELKICEEGINKCQPLISKGAKYSKCMYLMCYKYYSEKEKKETDDSKFYFEYVGIQEDKTTKVPKGKVAEEMARTCEYGLRKCDSLASNPEYYWECMTESCRNPDENAQPDCEAGRNQCVDQQRIYNDCMKLTCGDQAATFSTCPAAKSSCNESFRTYWQCVYRVCLGPVDKFVRPATSKKFMVVKDKNGIKRRIQVNMVEPLMPDVPAWSAKAPQGVDPVEWTHSTPQKFMLMGNPSDYMRCMIPTAMISCDSDDIRSCSCSDGTVPIMVNGVPSPKYGDD